jgi:hypothetical protein
VFENWPLITFLNYFCKYGNVSQKFHHFYGQTERRQSFTGRHGVTSSKNLTSINTAVKIHKFLILSYFVMKDIAVSDFIHKYIISSLCSRSTSA